MEPIYCSAFGNAENCGIDRGLSIVQNFGMKTSLRRALRGMTACGAAATIFILLINISSGRDLAHIAGAAVVGIISAPALWFAYRVFRFAVGH